MFTRLTTTILLCGSLLAAEAEDPWSDAWTMTLRGEDRVFVDYGDTSYMRAQQSDLEDAPFLDGKDVMIAAKFAGFTGTMVRLYDFPDLRVGNDIDTWSAYVDGDNLYVFGTVQSIGEDLVQLDVHDVALAPGDGAIIDARLSEVRQDDWQGRLAVVAWVRQTGKEQGNSEFWMETADEIVKNTINRAVDQARSQRDAELAVQAMTWAIDRLGNRHLAAQIGSMEWIAQTDQAAAEAVATHMNRLGLVAYEGTWLSEAEALEREFNDRFEAIDFRDAEAFYQLALWVDQYADILPQAPELRHKALQAGLKADNSHNGIRRALGLPEVATGAGAVANHYTDADAAIIVEPPDHWQRTAQPLAGDASWVPGANDTAYLAIAVISPDSEGAPNPEAVWTQTTARFAVRDGAEEIASDLDLSNEVRQTAFRYQEGSYQRGATVLMQTMGEHVVVWTASYLVGEADTVLDDLPAFLDNLRHNDQEAEAAAGDDTRSPANSDGIAPNAATEGNGDQTDR